MASTGAADEWDVIVPANGEQLMAELARHGVRPGQRLHLAAVSEADRCDDAPEALPDYIGSFASGQPDLAERAREILRAEFPDR